MAIVKPNEKPYSNKIRKTYGFNAHLGNNRIGKIALGLENPEAGVYRVDNPGGHQKTIRSSFYIPTNPRTEKQQANRQKLANAVANWQGLTEEEKKSYNKRAKGKPYSGFNLYIKEYMLS